VGKPNQVDVSSGAKSGALLKGALASSLLAAAAREPRENQQCVDSHSRNHLDSLITTAGSGKFNGRRAWARAIVKLSQEGTVIENPTRPDTGEVEASGGDTHKDEGVAAGDAGRGDAAGRVEPGGRGSLKGKGAKGKWGIVFSKLGLDKRDLTAVGVINSNSNVNETNKDRKEHRQMDEICSPHTSAKGGGINLDESIDKRHPRNRNETIKAARLAFRRRSISEDNCPLFMCPTTGAGRLPSSGLEAVSQTGHGRSQELSGIICSSNDFQVGLLS